MSEQPFRWGVVGLGRHFDRYIGAAINNSTTSRLVAVGSRDADKAKTKVAPYGSVHVHTNLEDVLRDDDVEGIVLLTPNHLHFDQVLQIAASGRHVLCEKPLGNSAFECLEMVRACTQAGVRLGVGFHLRHNQVHRQAHDYVMEGLLGRLELVECRYFHIEGPPDASAASSGGWRTPDDSWRNNPAFMGGGRYTSTGGHAVDLVRFVTGLEVDSADALQDPVGGVQNERLIHSSFVLDNGCIAAIDAGWQTYPFNELVLCGTEGSLRCTDTIGNDGGGRLELLSNTKSENTVFDKHDVYMAEIDSFVTSVRAGEIPDANGVDGLRALEITEAVYEAISNGSRVTLRRNEVAN